MMQWVVKLESGIFRTKHISDMGHVEFQLHPRLSLQVGQVTPRRVIKFQMLTIIYYIYTFTKIKKIQTVKLTDLVCIAFQNRHICMLFTTKFSYQFKSKLKMWFGFEAVVLTYIILG